MPLQFDHLFEPANPYNKYVPILRQSLFERWESTARILGGRYSGDKNSRLADIKQLFASGMPFYRPPIETGVLADLALAFVFDYTADKCFELRCYIEKTKGFLHSILSISYPFLMMIEIAATVISIILRSILSRVVALTLFPVLLLAHAVCAWQERLIQNKIDVAIQACDDSDQSELNIMKKVLYEAGKEESDQYAVRITSFEEPEYFLFQDSFTSFAQVTDPQEGESRLISLSYQIYPAIFNTRNPNKVKVFVQFSDGVYAEVNVNLAAIKKSSNTPDDAEYWFTNGASIKPISVDNHALHEVLTDAAKPLTRRNRYCQLDAEKIASCLNKDNKVKVALFKTNYQDGSHIQHSFSFFPSSKTLNALESMAGLTLHADYASEVATNKTKFSLG